jgi:hypothetical protein
VFESVCTCRILLLKYLLPCATCWELYYTRHSDKSLKCHFPSEKEGLILDRARKAEYNKAITCFILRKSRLKLGPFIMHSLGKRTLQIRLLVGLTLIGERMQTQKRRGQLPELVIELNQKRKGLQPKRPIEQNQRKEGCGQSCLWSRPRKKEGYG